MKNHTRLWNSLSPPRFLTWDVRYSRRSTLIQDVSFYNSICSKPGQKLLRQMSCVLQLRMLFHSASRSNSLHAEIDANIKQSLIDTGVLWNTFEATWKIKLFYHESCQKQFILVGLVLAIVLQSSWEKGSNPQTRRNCVLWHVYTRSPVVQHEPWCKGRRKDSQRTLGLSCQSLQICKLRFQLTTLVIKKFNFAWSVFCQSTHNIGANFFT